MNNEFKVGDRVKVVSSGWNTHQDEVGDIFTIETIAGSYCAFEERRPKMTNPHTEANVKGLEFVCRPSEGGKLDNTRFVEGKFYQLRSDYPRLKHDYIDFEGRETKWDIEVKYDGWTAHPIQKCEYGSNASGNSSCSATFENVDGGAWQYYRKDFVEVNNPDERRFKVGDRVTVNVHEYTDGGNLTWEFEIGKTQTIIAKTNRPNCDWELDNHGKIPEKYLTLVERDGQQSKELDIDYKTTKEVAKMDYNEVKKFNPVNLAKAAKEAQEELSSTEEQNAKAMYIQLINEKESTERTLADYGKQLKEIKEKLKIFEGK